MPDTKNRHVNITIKLSAKDRRRLTMYLDDLGMSLQALTRRLVIEELRERRQFTQYVGDTKVLVKEE